MRRKLPLAVAVIAMVAVAPVYFLVTGLASSSTDSPLPSGSGQATAAVDPEVATRFEYLSANGNSSCSRAFMDSIASMPDDMRLRGSCCGPMSLHRYSEQVAALRKFSDITEIPPDPYDIDAGLAAGLMGYYDVELTPDEQKAYDVAMQNSNEQGPCCCQCWRWEVYGGLAKDLIRNHGFSGEQVTGVWNLSNGCGGDGEHFHEPVTSGRSPPQGGFPVGQEVRT